MSGGCIYPILNSYFPSKIFTNCKSLKYISACSLIQYLARNDAAQFILRSIPFSVYKFLFQTSIKYFYMTKLADQTCLSHLPRPIVHLLFHWPCEAFYLADVFPFHKPDSNNKDPYYSIGTEIQRIYGVLVDEICEYFYEIDSSLYTLDFLQELDLTGNFGYNTDLKYMDPKFILKELNRKYSAESSKSNCSNFKYKFSKEKHKEITEKKIKLIIGTVINSNEDIEAMKKIIDLNNKQTGSGIIIQFKRILQNCSPPPWKLLSSVLFANKCQSLRLIYIGHDVDFDVFCDICEGLPQLQDLSILGSSLPSLSCLKHFQQLEHLSLVGKGVSGQFEHVNDLKMGLKYLKLVDSKLTSSDLDSLRDSHHVESLQQLDIYHYYNSAPNDKSSGLLGLCQRLKMIKVLQFNYCYLHLWSNSHLVSLIDILKSLPNLTILDLLRRSKFNEDQLLVIVAKISSSLSLKIIAVDYPVDVDENTREDFKVKFRNALNMEKDAQEFEVILGLKNISIVSNIY